MKKTIITSILAACILMTSCETATTASTRKIDKVEIGMSKQDIRKLFGTPFYKRANEIGEQWAYRKMVGDILQPEEAIFIVTFDSNGSVAEYETMKPFEFHRCYQ